MVLSPETPIRRSRRQAGKDSGVEWSKDMLGEPEVAPDARGASMITYAMAGHGAPADSPKPFLKPKPKKATPKKASAKKATPKKATPKKTTPKKKATPKKKTPKKTAVKSPKSPKKAESPVAAEKAIEQDAGQDAVLTGESFVGGDLFSFASVVVMISVCPLLCTVLSYITTHPKIMTIENFYETCTTDGWKTCLNSAIMWGFEWQVGDRTHHWQEAAQFLVVFVLVGVALMQLPGATVNGPQSPKGFTPTYTDNGVTHCALFTLLFVLGSKELGAGLYSLGIMFDLFPGILCCLNIFGLCFGCLLVYKGYFYPSGPDTTYNGYIFDFYWGVELYPRILGIDVKTLVNCRFSMTFWMLSGISFSAASYARHEAYDPGLVLSAVSLYVYLAKFYWWEMGYMRSIDIIVDKCGFYETWGCLVWVPAVYTLHLRACVLSPSDLSWEVASGIFVLSLVGVVCNYLADRQRDEFRKANGKMTIWGKPPRYIHARYNAYDEHGILVTKESLLLASGFWGVARHFQYFFELLAAWSWGLLAGVARNKIGLFYPIFLTILLVHRAMRDQNKCLDKYGRYYQQYMAMVPYKIIPGLY